MSKSEKKNKFTAKLKRSFKKVKYLDKTQASYFIVTGFIATFLMFTGITYSYFTFSKNLNAATITIAKLNYILESDTDGYANQKIIVPAGETKFVDLSLKSLNSERTKYALKYNTNFKDVKVYYSETLKKNISGIIGAVGSVIDMRVVLVNEGEEDAEVEFDISGGYIQNTLKSNITAGYFEQDLTIRPTVYDENFENPTQIFNFPSKEEYSFYKVECSNGVVGTFDTETWTLNRDDTTKKTSCDVYFKKANAEVETYYKILGNNETSKITTIKPDNNGLYRYTNNVCNNVSDYTFDEATFEFKVKDYTKNALCVANFMTDETIENSDKFIAYFDAAGGKVKTSNKTILKGGKYGALPKPTYENHMFMGWFTESEGGEEITSSSTVSSTGDVKLYAHWNESSQVDVTINTLKKTLDTDVFATTDDYGTSYYYPSTSTNNYVKYGDFYWRIIRVNGDGSLRLVYDGTKAHDNGEVAEDRTIGLVAWNKDNKNDNKYVGYMYGYANGIASTIKSQSTANMTNSNAKDVLENWYKENILNKGFALNVSDNIFCNDRISLEGTGFGTNATHYNAWNRILNEDGTLKEDIAPQVSCADINDAFTVRDTVKGNGALDYSIGLLSIDDVMLVGGAGEGSYLNRGTSFWTSTPSSFDASAKMFIAGGSSYESEVTTEHALVPVINLSAEYASLMEGDGSKENPHFVR